MNKRILAAVLAACLLLSGCQLARPDAQKEQSPDRLVGVFVTTEYLDLFNTEAYLNEHLTEIMNGSATVEDHSQYSNQLFARRVEDNGKVRYVFEGLEGILMASYLIRPQGNLNEYWLSDTTEGICDVSFGHHSRDDGYDAAHSGTIYISNDYGDASFYHNPVYQTPEGQVYLISGQGISFLSTDCGSTTHTLREEGTLTENGKATSYTSEIKVTIEAVDPARTIRVFQMDASNQVISKHEYSVDDLPTELTAQKGTAYILVEEHTGLDIRRSLYQSSDLSITVFRELENSICVKHQLQIQWPE